MLSDSESLDETEGFRFLLPQDVGDTEDVEEYRLGGLHPVHLGDKYDDGRYTIVHKLGAGGFSTVWLARDGREQEWVALKIIKAEAYRKYQNGILKITNAGEHCTQFNVSGPNGCHLCLVLPVLGPSASTLSYNFESRLTPKSARRAAFEATKAVRDFHQKGLTHGDVTTGNLLFTISSLKKYTTKQEIYSLFGRPVTGILETESGEPHGPEAPQYIVKSLDFLAASFNMIRHKMELIDFDQSFPTSSPPQEMLGTPLEFMAPEIACGFAPSPASDIWALGCCFLRLRSGDTPFSNPYEVNCPQDLMNYIVYILGGNTPSYWVETRWDQDGKPTKDPQGLLNQHSWDDDETSLQEIIRKIWDEPKDGATGMEASIQKDEPSLREDRRKFSSHFSRLVWNPRAVIVNGDHLDGYTDDWDMQLETLPKISDDEASQLYDLLSKIFVYDPKSRPTATELLEHPWFH